MKILITGGAGFLGKNLVQYLIDHTDDQIEVFDTFASSSYDDFEKLLSTFTSQQLERIEFSHTDVRDLADIRKFDQIYHLACPASPPAYQETPLATLHTAIHGTEHMLLHKRLDATLLIASTSEVYGDPVEHPQKETTKSHVNPMGPRACYDVGKMAAETLAWIYQNEGQDYDNIRVVRIFNTYGPHMSPHDGRVMTNFLTQCLRSEPLTVYGNVSRIRSFCYVDDMVRGLVSAMNAEKGWQGALNLGNPNCEITIPALAHLIRNKVGKLFGSTSEITLTFPDVLIDDPTHRKPDITKAMGLLGWSPRIDLEDGIMRTAEWLSTVLLNHELEK